MTRRKPPQPPVPPSSPADPGLTALGLLQGDRVRWRDRPGGRWREGRVEGCERDGSLAIRDGRGASRALHHDRVEVAGRGPRGGALWEPVAERAARTEQLALWRGPASGDDRAQ